MFMSPGHCLCLGVNGTLAPGANGAREGGAVFGKGRRRPVTGRSLNPNTSRTSSAGHRLRAAPKLDGVDAPPRLSPPPREGRIPPPPLEGNDRIVTGVFTAGWAIALAVLLGVRGSIPAGGRWWTWTCVAGLVLGLFGFWYVPRLKRGRERAAQRRTARQRPGGG